MPPSGRRSSGFDDACAGHEQRLGELVEAAAPRRSPAAARPARHASAEQDRGEPVVHELDAEVAVDGEHAFVELLEQQHESVALGAQMLERVAEAASHAVDRRGELTDLVAEARLELAREVALLDRPGRRRDPAQAPCHQGRGDEPGCEGSEHGPDRGTDDLVCGRSRSPHGPRAGAARRPRSRRPDRSGGAGDRRPSHDPRRRSARNAGRRGRTRAPSFRFGTSCQRTVLSPYDATICRSRENTNSASPCWPAIETISCPRSPFAIARSTVNPAATVWPIAMLSPFAREIASGLSRGDARDQHRREDRDRDEHPREPPAHADPESRHELSIAKPQRPTASLPSVLGDLHGTLSPPSPPAWPASPQRPTVNLMRLWTIGRRPPPRRRVFLTVAHAATEWEVRRTFDRVAPFTVGAEEEYVLIDPETHELVPAAALPRARTGPRPSGGSRAASVAARGDDRRLRDGRRAPGGARRLARTHRLRPGRVGAARRRRNPPAHPHTRRRSRPAKRYRELGRASSVGRQTRPDLRSPRARRGRRRRSDARRLQRAPLLPARSWPPSRPTPRSIAARTRAWRPCGPS